MCAVAKTGGKTFYPPSGDPEYLASFTQRVDNLESNGFSIECPQALCARSSCEVFSQAVKELNDYLAAVNQLGAAESMIGGAFGAILGAAIFHKSSKTEISMGVLAGAYALAWLFRDRKQAESISMARKSAQEFFDTTFTDYFRGCRVLPILHATYVEADISELPETVFF